MSSKLENEQIQAVKSWTRRYFIYIEWGSGVLLSVLAVVAWAQTRLGGAGALGTYDIFPLFGLLAFSLMASHYINGAIGRFSEHKGKPNDAYWVASSALVLVLMIAHPLLLNYGLVRDGLGLPPASYVAAYSEGVLYAFLLGIAGLAIFLLFELKRWFGARKWWRWVEYLQIVGMVTIAIHALVLGRELQHGWYRWVWLAQLAVLVGVWIYSGVVAHNTNGGNDERE